MRPSGRKAIRQGSSKVLTVVIVKGTLASGFCSPTLTWAQAATDARVKSNGAFANFIVISLLDSQTRKSTESSLHAISFACPLIIHAQPVASTVALLAQHLADLR